MKNSVDRRPRWITPFSICRILHILRKPNSMIVLLFLQNNSKYKNKLKHANFGRCKFISIIEEFTLIVASWVIRARWREIQDLC